MPPKPRSRVPLAATQPSAGGHGSAEQFLEQFSKTVESGSHGGSSGQHSISFLDGLSAGKPVAASPAAAFAVAAASRMADAPLKETLMTQKLRPRKAERENCNSHSYRPLAEFIAALFTMCGARTELV